jgi:hypothetical protein
MSNLKELIPLCISNFIEQVSEKYNIDLNELLNTWDSVSQINIKDIKIEKKIKNVEKENKEENKQEEKENKTSNKTCIYIMKSGKNSGQSCGAKLSDKSQLEMFCNRHIKEEEKVLKARGAKIETENIKEKEDKKDHPKLNKINKDFNNNIKPELANLIEKQRQKISVVKNLFGNYEHPETHFVINITDKIFYGKQLDDGRVIDLNAEDISICKLYNMKYLIPTNIISTDPIKKQSVTVEDYVSSEEEISDEEDN